MGQIVREVDAGLKDILGLSHVRTLLAVHIEGDRMHIETDDFHPRLRLYHKEDLVMISSNYSIWNYKVELYPDDPNIPVWQYANMRYFQSERKPSYIWSLKWALEAHKDGQRPDENIAWLHRINFPRGFTITIDPR